MPCRSQSATCSRSLNDFSNSPQGLADPGRLLLHHQLGVVALQPQVVGIAGFAAALGNQPAAQQHVDVPSSTSTAPMGVMAKISRPGWPERFSRSLASRKAGALIRVSVVPSDAASDIGINSREAASFCSCASRIRMGSIIAVTIRWCENAASAAVAGITTAIVRHSLPPAARAMPAPMRSVMPVADRPADSTNTAATMIAGSLEKPDSASFGPEDAGQGQRQQRQHGHHVDAQLLADEQRQGRGQDDQEDDLLRFHRRRGLHFEGIQASACVSHGVKPRSRKAKTPACARVLLFKLVPGRGLEPPRSCPR